MNDSNEIQLIQPSELAADTSLFTDYLSQLGLPIDNVIATTEERNLIATNLPSFLQSLAPEQLQEARYLSKFVGATAIGLFDAGLNYVWNEVVLNLRKKASIYGIDLFFDAAVGGSKRTSYRDEDDLPGLKDSVLLNTCLKLELLSEVVYRKIDHILTMRNELAASHPCVESIGAFELLGWLQTCVKDVINDAPSDSAIRIKAIIYNLRSHNSVFDQASVTSFVNGVQNLSTPHVHNLLITMFSMYVDPQSCQILRKNISLLSPSIWVCAESRVKYKIGARIEGYRTNLHNERLARGTEFLEIVDGLSFETLSTRIIQLSILNAELVEAHRGRDNFYNEPPVMEKILAYCKRSSDIPVEILPQLVKTVLACRIGRGLSYCKGVSQSGLPMYDKFFGMLDDDGIIHLVISLFDPGINSKLGYSKICREHLKAVLMISRNVAIGGRLIEVIDYLLADIENAHRASSQREFKELTRPLITWN